MCDKEVQQEGLQLDLRRKHRSEGADVRIGKVMKIVELFEGKTCFTGCGVDVAEAEAGGKLIGCEHAGGRETEG